MPRPIAAGVFGMARTMRGVAASAGFEKAAASGPAMIETTTVLAPIRRRERRHDLRRDLRLDRDHDGGDLADRRRAAD